MQTAKELKKYLSKRKELQNQIKKLKQEIKTLDSKYIEIITSQKK